MVPILLSSLKSDDPRVVTQSIISGTSLFCAVLEEMALQVLFVAEYPINGFYAF